jgi:hypothetical protein
MRNCKLSLSGLLAVLAVLLLVVAGESARAQRGGGGGGGGQASGMPPLAPVTQVPHVNSVDKDMKDLAKTVTLTPEQEPKVREIVTTRNQQITDLLKQYNDAMKGIDAADKKKSQSKGNQAGAAAGSQTSGTAATAQTWDDLVAKMPADSVKKFVTDTAQNNLKILRGNAMDQIKALFTDEQKGAYDAWMEKHGKGKLEEEAKDFQYPTPQPGPGGR